MNFAEVLRSKKGRILATWEANVRRRIPNIKFEKQVNLMNSMPIVIDVLSDILAEEVPEKALEERASSLSIAHGRERAEIRSYTIEELIEEYHIFRAVLFSELESDNETIPVNERDLLLNAIEISVRNAIKHFIEGQKENEATRSEQLAESKETVRILSQRYDLLINEIEDVAIFGIDADGTLSTWNKGVLKVSGYNEDEFIGQPYCLIFCEKEKDNADPQRELELARELGVYRKASWCHRKDGSLYWGSQILTPVRNEAGKFIGYTMIIKDSTEEKKTEDQLRLAKQIAEDANAAKSAFLANVSHEIRTPLGIILGYAGMVEEASQVQEVRNYGATIRRSGENLLELVNDLLDLSKAESGKVGVKIDEITTIPFIQDIVSFLAIKSNEKGLALSVDFKSPLPKCIWSDKSRLRQILINVIGNAIKFTESGGVVLAPMCIEREKGKHSFIFRISDSGIGIAPERRDMIFDPFVQGEEYITRRFGGSGLGLSIARRIARELGGSVTLKSSELGKGSVFDVQIEPGDLDQADWYSVAELQCLASKHNIPAAAVKCQDLPKSSKMSLDGLHVLVVEDLEENQTLISLLLKREGAEVDIASDGFEGVDKAQRGNYDAVLMDIQMPTKNGYEATSDLRNLGYDRPIIALTAHAMKGVRECTLTAGFDDYITKPIDSKNLTRVITHSIKKRGHSTSDRKRDESLDHSPTP